MASTGSRTYYYEGGEHRFDPEGRYLGWFEKGEEPGEKGMGPFDGWEFWDVDKHKLLTDTLGFKLRFD